MTARATPPAILELMAKPRWVVWRWEERDGKRTKPPFDARTGEYAKSNDPATWCPYARAEAAAADFDGVGFNPTGEYIGVDLDHCLNPEAGALEPWAAAIVERLASYTEITPSGTGVRVWLRGRLPGSGRVKRGLGAAGQGALELYSDGRYFTVTGDHFPGTPATIEARPEALSALLREWWPPAADTNGHTPSAEPVDLDDAGLLERAKAARNGTRFTQLWAGDWAGAGYPSQSEADHALANLLAFWTGRDAARMDRLFRQSGLMRPKWDARHFGDGRTYGAGTIARAIAGCAEVYEPRRSAPADATPEPDGARGPSAASEPAGTGPRFRPAADVLTEPRPVAVVDGIAWRRSVTVLVSESGVGKTFVLLDLAGAVGDDRPWHGRAVRGGAVAYVSFEGDALGLRLLALREAGASLAHLHILQAGEPLSPRVDRDGTEHPSAGETLLAEALAALAHQLAATGAPPLRLLVVDTVRASLVGSEDSSEHISAYLRAIRRLLAPHPEAAALLAHHAGWQDGETKRKRERGSSAFRGNADATLYLEVTSEDAELGTADLSLTALKVRDDAKPGPLRLIRRRVILPIVDEQGRPYRTCRIEDDPRSQADLDAAETAAQTQADADLDQRAYDLIARGTVTSIKTLRLLLGIGYDESAGALARLVQAGRVRPPVGQRAPYIVVDGTSRTEAPSSTESHSVPGTASSTAAPPIGGSATRARRSAR